MLYFTQFNITEIENSEYVKYIANIVDNKNDKFGVIIYYINNQFDIYFNIDEIDKYLEKEIKDIIPKNIIKKLER